MGWLKRIHNLFRSNDLSREIEREMAFHIAERTDDLVAHGMPRGAARDEARRRFGNLGQQREQTRERDLVAWLDTLVSDARYALRALRAAPAFAGVAVLSLGLGIGANTAIFTLINTVLLKTLPVSHPEELVLVTRDGSTDFTNPLWEAIRDRQDVLSGAAAYAPTAFNLSDGGEVRRAAANFVSGDFFSMLGVRPVLGRLIARADDVRGCPAAAVISAGFWESEYGAGHDVLGKTVALNGKPFPIIGVVDPRFFGVEVGDRTSIYAPLCTEAIVSGASNQLDARSNWWLRILARPKPGVSIALVKARLALLSRGISEATLPGNYPTAEVDQYLRGQLSVDPAPNGFSGLRTQYRKPLWVMMGVVAVVLLIACANVANLLLARAKAREREMAVRLALGAGRGRLARQMLTESLCLALLGAILGAVFASSGTRALVAMMSTTSRAVALDLTVDMRVLGFTVAVASATGILFGLVPAWRAQRVDPHLAMRSHGRGVTDGHSRYSIGKALVVAQVALSLVLVAGAGLLLGSWRRLATLDPGFRSSGVITAGTTISRAQAGPEQRAALFTQIRDRLRATPGVIAVSRARRTPMAGGSWNSPLRVDGFAAKSDRDALVWMSEVSDEYFATLGTAFIAGRDFNAGDLPTSPLVAIVTETLAGRFFGTTSAVGRQFRLPEGKDVSPPYEIVGVVKDSKYNSLRQDQVATAYLALSQAKQPSASTHFVIRFQGDVGVGIGAVRTVFHDIAPRATLGINTLDRQLAESIRLPRTLATLSGFFGALALVLATIGVYGIMAYSVARRRNEIGVRIALGAARARVVRMVLGETGRLVIAGVVLGTILAFASMKLVAAFLYGVKPTDPWNLAIAATVLAVVGLGAALLPAARAARLDPVAALRED